MNDGDYIVGNILKFIGIQWDIFEFSFFLFRYLFVFQIEFFIIVYGYIIVVSKVNYELFYKGFEIVIFGRQVNGVNDG